MELKIENISKDFKKKRAVSNVNLSLNEGVHALLGANGSGKTTLFRMLCGLTKSESGGNVYLDEINMYQQYNSYLFHLGYMPQHFGFYPHYTVEEFLNYMGVVKGLKKDYIKQRINELLIQLNLESKKNSKMKSLSGGMIRRVGIAQALLNNPKILILDEPTAGLDPKERINFRNMISSLSKDTIILLSTHIVSDIENLADDILVMKNGEIIYHNTEDNLLDTMKEKVWEITVTNKEAQQLLQDYVIVKTQLNGDYVTLRLLSDNKPHEHASLLTPSLDDFYLYHFEDEGEEHETINQARI